MNKTKEKTKDINTEIAKLNLIISEKDKIINKLKTEKERISR